MWCYDIRSSLDCKLLNKSFTLSAPWYQLLKVLQHSFWCPSRIHSWSPFVHPLLELDRCIGNTHHRGRLWDNRNHRNNRQSMTIGDRSVPMFHDVTHRIHLAMDSIGHPCSTI